MQMIWPFSKKYHGPRELRHAQKERANINKKQRKRYAEAEKAQMSLEDLRDLAIEHSYEDSQYYDEIKRIISSSLLERAEALLLETPPFIHGEKGNELWEESAHDGRYRLSNRGIQKVRDQIREEEKKRRDEKFAWLDLASKVVAMLVGLIGVTIGLVSVIKR